MRKPIFVLFCLVSLFTCQAQANQAPVADAGLARYAASAAVVLDGTGSFDPDPCDTLSYQWQQISGPAVTITDDTTATPTISGFTQTGDIQECQFELVVSDGSLASDPDTVKVVIVPDYTTSTTIEFLNPPFDVNKPTVIFSYGGDCVTGGGDSNRLYRFDDWRPFINLINVVYYEPPYTPPADAVIVLLSEWAPDYKQPIQTMGHSTGGKPAMDIAIRLNVTYHDPRYAVNHATLLDAPCRDETNNINTLLDCSVDGERCWVDNYYSIYGWAYPRVLNVEFDPFVSSHFTPYEWYVRGSLDPCDWYNDDIYSNGVTAGAYFSVIGQGKNLHLGTGTSKSPVTYRFEWQGENYPDYDPNFAPGYLTFFDQASYPGKLPEPVTLLGPADGANVDASGALLSCESSENAVGYQLLFGPDPYHMNYAVSDTPGPPCATITTFPFEQTFWSVKARDEYGTSIYADPICVNAENVEALICNLTTGKNYSSIQEAIDDAAGTDNDIVLGLGTYLENIDFKGKSLTLRSTDPNDPAVVAATIVDGCGRDPVVTFSSGENASSILAGLTITNGCGNYGGGIYCQGSSPTIKNCIITGNSADRSPAYGGGIYCDFSNPTLTNCIIRDNIARQGGGMYNYNYSCPTVTNCTFTANSADSGGGILNNSYSDPIITNSILWGNLPQQIVEEVSSTASVTHSDIQGSWPGAGNIAQDPSFAFDTDLHLVSDSPCIDTGTNTPPGGLPAADIEGNPRPLDGDGDVTAVADMGICEYNLQAPSIAVSAPEINFSCVHDWSSPDPQTLLVRNCGGGTLNWEITEDCPWLQVSPSTGQSTGNVNETTIAVDSSSLTAGYYCCELTVVDPQASNTPKTVEAQLCVRPQRYVPSKYATIQAAVSAASDGGVVVVAPGTYVGAFNRDIDFHGKAITVKSETGPENCIIDCQTLGGGFYLQSNEDANSVIAGFTITNGYATQGGAIHCNQSSPTITNCRLIGNTAHTIQAPGRGGGIYCEESNATISDCAIIGNSAESRGGGIHCKGQEPVITNCSFTRNFAQGGGAGVSCGADTNPTITNCRFSGNSTPASGGAIYLGRGAGPTITNCTITDNRAETSGGGIYCHREVTPKITNCILWPNEAPDGPEICLKQSSVASVSYADVNGGQGGVYIEPGCTLNFEPGNIDADPLFVDPGLWDPNGTPGDTSDDYWVDGDYHLKSAGWRLDTARSVWVWDDVTSRCIDAGNPGCPLGGEPLSVPIDPDNIWGQNLRINMGAFGGTAEASMPPYNWALLADLTNDGTVDSTDLAELSANWLSSGIELSCDLNRDEIINMLDFALLAYDWLGETTWH